MNKSEIERLEIENAALRKAMLSLLLVHHMRAESEARGNLIIADVKAALRKIDPKVRTLRDLKGIAPENALRCATAIWSLADGVSL